VERVVLNALAKISTVSVAAAVPAAMGSVRRRNACHYRITLRRESRVRQIGCAPRLFLAPVGTRELPREFPKSLFHQSLITITGEVVALGVASVLVEASE
jgi:hypothetical protein